MSLSTSSTLLPSTPLANPEPAGSSHRASARRGLALWYALVAGVIGLGTPGGARAQSESSASAPTDGETAAAADSSAASMPVDHAGACLEKHAEGQEFRLNGKLLEGRDAFLRCSATQCPAQIQRDCLNYLEQIQVQIPSVAFRVSADGVSRADVKVFVDGTLVMEKLSGKALDLNPGSHEVRIVLEPFPAHEETLVVSEGDKFRMVDVAFTTPMSEGGGEQPAPLPEMHRPTPVLSYVFGGVSAAGLISGIAWGLSSRGLQKDLEENCAPQCKRESVDVLKQRALIADVSFAVAASSLAAAGIFYLIRPEVPVEESVQVGVTVLDQHGAIGTVSIPASF